MIPISGPIVRQFNFGERGIVALFRGAGGLLGSLSSSGPSGIDTLNAHFQEAFQDYFWTSQVFDSYEGDVFSFREVGSEQAQAWLNQFDTIGRIAGVGYSAGGISATRFSSNQAPGLVNLQIQVDSFDPLTGNSSEDEALPANVVKGINYYQRRNRLNVFAPGYDLLDLQGVRTVQGSENINTEELFDDRSITHRNIINQSRLQQQILQDVETFVLEDLEFDRQGLLSFEGGAVPLNNIVRLAPGENGEAGQVFIANPIAIDPDFSFSTRFEFRLNPETISPGLAFGLRSPQLSGEIADVSLVFDPLAFLDQPENTVSLRVSEQSVDPLAVVSTPLDLDNGDPLTAWINYDGITDQFDVFLGDTLTQPQDPLLSFEFDLLEAVGPQAIFGFRTTVGGQERQADLLSWQLTPIPSEAEADTATVVPNTFLNLDLTARAVESWLGESLSYQPFEVGGLELADLFDESAYLQLNPDVATAVQSGVFTSGYDHFITSGWLEGRNPSSVYDEAFYLANNSDVAEAVASGFFGSGFEHFAQMGHIEGRDPSEQFDQQTYLTLNPDVADVVTNGGLLSAFEHWIEAGATEGRNPQGLLFQEGFYLAQNPDVVAEIASGSYSDGVDYYLQVGCREQHNPSPLFDESQYLALNPDIATAVSSGRLPCGFAHYLLNGRFEGRPFM